MEQKTKYTTKGMIFLILFLLIILIVNMVYSKFILESKQVYRQEKIYQDYIKNMTEKKIDYAFFGDSRPADGIYPEFIPGSFNFATIGETPIEGYYKFNRIVNIDNVKVNNIILQMDSHTLSSYAKEDGSNLIKEIPLYSKFVPYSEISKIIKKTIIGVWLEAKFPFLGNGRDFSIFIIKPELPEIILGGVKKYGNFSEMNKTEEGYKRYKELYKWSRDINNVCLEYFIKTVELAKKNNINVIFIKYPVSKEYDDALKENNVSREEHYKKIFNEVDKILNNSYYVLDYYSIFADNSDYFYDSDHLNYIGAENFSKKINEDLKNLNLKASNSSTEVPKIKESNKKGNNALYFILICETIILVVFICSLRMILKYKKLHQS